MAEINLSSYVNELVYSLDDSLNKTKHNVSINCSVDDIQLDVSQAIPVGIILNEAVTNALKYAFPGNRSGDIAIKVIQVDQDIEMQVADNGVGLPEDFNLFKANSLGITLIDGLTAQLKGVFNVIKHNGLTLSVKFPMESNVLTGKAVSFA